MWPQSLHNVFADSLFQHPRLRVQRLQLLVQLLQPLGEVELVRGLAPPPPHIGQDSGSTPAPRSRPALQPCTVPAHRHSGPPGSAPPAAPRCRPSSPVPRPGRAARCWPETRSAPERSPGARGRSAGSLPRVDEQHLVLSLGVALPSIQEPERAGQRHGVEEVGADRDHHIHGPRFDQLTRISSSLPRASPAELAITKPARPVSFSARRTPESRGSWRCPSWAGRRGSGGRP